MAQYATGTYVTAEYMQGYPGAQGREAQEQGYTSPVNTLKAAPDSGQQPPFDYAPYIFPEPEILPQFKRKANIKVLAKDSDTVNQKRLQDLVEKQKVNVKKPAVRPPISDDIPCVCCMNSKPNSTIKCHLGHMLCIDCAATRYFDGALKCPTCEAHWSMLQILTVHFVICGETMPNYFQRRPQEIKIPLEGAICIGMKHFISERLEDQKQIEFPKEGHLTYKPNLAIEACPNNHNLCKTCATNIVRDGDQNCPKCHTKLRFELPPEPCEEQAAAAKK